MRIISIFGALALTAGIVKAQQCRQGLDYYYYEEFEPFFFQTNGSTTNVTCNIDPSQGALDYAVAVGGEFCIPPMDNVTITMIYTGVNANPSTASIITTVSEGYYSSINLVFSGLPASAISNGSPLTISVVDEKVKASSCGGSTSFYGQTNYTATQTFIQTLFYTEATATATVTVPSSTTTTTSVLTDQSVTDAPVVSTTITTASSTDTVVASSTITTTSTRTVTQRTVTKSIIVKKTTKVTSSCLPSSSAAAAGNAARWVGRAPAVKWDKRQANSSSTTFVTGYCQSPLLSTTITTATDVTISTYSDPASTTTDTTYSITTVTSTFTPTNTYYVSAVTTITVTPTVTKKHVTVLKKMTTTNTYTTTVTVTKYPVNPTTCKK